MYASRRWTGLNTNIYSSGWMHKLNTEAELEMHRDEEQVKKFINIGQQNGV